jgi:hypothetical protein
VEPTGGCDGRDGSRGAGLCPDGARVLVHCLLISLCQVSTGYAFRQRCPAGPGRATRSRASRHGGSGTSASRNPPIRREPRARSRHHPPPAALPRHHPPPAARRAMIAPPSAGRGRSFLGKVMIIFCAIPETNLPAFPVRLRGGCPADRRALSRLCPGRGDGVVVVHIAGRRNGSGGSGPATPAAPRRRSGARRSPGRSPGRSAGGADVTSAT